MKPIRYSNGSLVVLGDKVTITKKRLFRSDHTVFGVVKYVVDTEKPMVRELNDYGADIQLTDLGQSLWYSCPTLPPNVQKVESHFEFTLLPPWEELHDDGIRLVSELHKELRPDHLLHGKSFIALAKRSDCDDVLFRVLDGDHQLAVVHLTWSGKTDPNKGWPSTSMYGDIYSWRVDCMQPDHEDYTS